MPVPSRRLAPRRQLLRHPLFKVAMAVLSVLCAAPGGCGGGGGSGLPGQGYQVPAPNTQVLTTAQVQQILNQAANAADNLGAPATIAVVDRVGNVLAVGVQAGVATQGANGTTCTTPPCALITSGTGATGGLEGAVVPSTYAAISKAITGAYLSSGGNAFSTRTANQIVQQHFPLGVAGNPGGPLFGVQFSQLACSDLIQTGSGATTGAGPHAAPLGLAADPGGLPLYLNGVAVGGIGVMSTAIYSINTGRIDGTSNDEAIAQAGQAGFAAPEPIQAPNIFVAGVSLDYLGPTPVPAVSSAVPAVPATLTPAPGFYAGGAIQTPQGYGTLGSGILPDSDPGVTDPLYTASFPNLNAYVLVNPATGHNRYDPFDPANAAKAPTDGNALTPAEAEALIGNALSVAAQARAGIRIPTNSNAQVSASVVDLDGNVLAIARLPDAPIFGIDVSLQKARSAVFFSRADAASAFHVIGALAAAAPSAPGGTFGYYMNAQSVGDPGLFNSGTAFSEVAIGNLARPFYPDGQDGMPNGPLSVPQGVWSVFSTGLQTDLISADLVHILEGGAVTTGCGTNVGLGPAMPVVETHTQIANGLQIFSGGFTIYRNGELIGALGISGDGIQQDALIAYIGIQGDGSIGVSGVPTVENAPPAIRADTVSVEGVDLVYITCPPAPFITSREQNPCF